jgi:hypothetical protein
LHLRENGQEKRVEPDSPYWMEIAALDAAGKPVDGLPPEGGCFEAVLPAALLDGNPRTLTLAWIDFYRD